TTTTTIPTTTTTIPTTTTTITTTTTTIPTTTTTTLRVTPSCHARPLDSLLQQSPGSRSPQVRHTLYSQFYPQYMLLSLTYTQYVLCHAYTLLNALTTVTQYATQYVFLSGPGAVISLDTKAERFQVLPNGTFLIRSVQVQDQGTYICSAQNSVGLDRAMVTLEVWSRPPRIQLPTHREATVHQGGEARLECRAQGVPVPLLSWVLPDRSILIPDLNSHGPHPRVSIFPNGTLRIVAVGPADRGLYRCVASNPAGASSLSVRLHVSFLPPAIQQPREERVTQPAGMPVYAHCSARGAPAPSIRWRTPDGTLLLPSQFLNGNLFLSTKDSGSYECLATNAVGGDKRKVRVQTAVVSGSGLSAVITISQSAGRVQSGSIG
uniref:Ig-like domain-containing protein n=1 Tax=Hucho hucho TaxID=62062 RepID=A0A4W5JSX8_9TELE